MFSRMEHKARSFGDGAAEEARDARGVRLLDQLGQDLRYGARTLLKKPGFAVVAVVTLGLGIGANTAIFSVVNGVFLKPLPYDNGERLVLLQQSAPLTSQPAVGISIKELRDYREQLTAFDGLVEFHQMNFDLLRRGEPDRVAVGVVSPNFFGVLGIRPLLGRTFVDGDDRDGADAVLVLGHSYWQTRFGGDPRIVGQVFQMNDRPHTVAGVLPPVPHYPNEVDVYMPTSACPFRAAAGRQADQNRRAFGALQVFGLLKPGVPAERAAAEVATVGERFRQTYPNVYRPGSGFQARTANVLDQLTAGARQMLLILLATTGLILLITCANVANLTIARMLTRDRELAMRAALGAGRWRLVRQLLTESLLLAVAGGAFGLLFAWLTLDMLTAFTARFTSRTSEIALDPRVLAFALGVSVITGLAFGIFPALASRVNPVSALKAGGKGSMQGGGRRHVQGALIVAQVAVSVVLLVGAGLLLLSFHRLQRVDPGFRDDRVVSAEVFGNFTSYPDDASLRRLYVSILERLDGAPGVTSAAVTNAVPLAGLQPRLTRFQIAGRTYDTPEQRPGVDVRVASAKYFDTLGIPLRRGRTFTELDHDRARQVAVVNEAMVKHWDGRDPLDTEVSFDNGETWVAIVGVVGNVRTFGLDRQDEVAQLYRPLRQSGGIAGRVLVRMGGTPDGAAAVIRDAVHGVDPNLPIENMRTLEEIRDRSLATPRLTATLLAVFAGLALLVTLAGITGVIATSVSQRTQEFGVRMALGGSRQGVLALVLRQGLLLVAVGLAIGIGAALIFSRALRTYLYQTAPTDPLTFAVVAAAFLVAGMIACLGPALRATAVDPIRALRAD